MSDIKSKIRALFKLAGEGSGASANECEIAISKAYALMQKYDVDESDVWDDEFNQIKLSSDDVVKHILLERSQIDPWHVSLAQATARMTGCRLIRGQYYREGYSGKRWMLWMVGFPNDIETAVIIYEWLDSQMRLAWANDSGRRKTRKGMESFYLGFAAQMFNRAEEESKKEKQRAIEDEQGPEAKHQLILVGKDKLVDQGLARLFEEIRAGKKRPGRTIDPESYRNGVAAANRASFEDRKRLT